MKNKTMWTLLIIVLLTLVICLYAIFSREEGPYEGIDAVKIGLIILNTKMK